MSTEWTGRRILKELCPPARRRDILVTFWREGEADARNLVAAALARNLNFRLESIRKAPPEKKADLLAMQLHVPQFEEPIEIALMLWHTSNAKELLAAFLDAWKIPHVDGSIEAEDYPVPGSAEVAKAVTTLSKTFAREDIVLYLATAGLLMGHEQPAWRESTWPEVDRLRGEAGGEGAGPAPSGAPVTKKRAAAPKAPAKPARATGSRKSRG